MNYQEFLTSKCPPVIEAGFVPKSALPEWFKPHQRDVVEWAIQKGQAALFESFGLGKTVQQLQILKWVHEHTGGKVLIVAPLGVRQEFTINDGPRMGLKIQYCRTDAEVEAADTPYIITNYERVRDGGIDPSQFTGASLDEASCLRSYGSLTTQTFSEVFRCVEYRFVATATPSPNEFLEIINYADFLGVMDRGLAMTRFFQRDSKKAGNLQLYPHEEKNFWLWVASWAVFLNSPADLGYDATGYDLPPMQVEWHEVDAPTEAPGSMCDSWGQPLLFEKPNAGIQHVSKQRRRTLQQRVEKAVEVINSGGPDDHWIVWHYLEDERREIQKQIPESVAVFGTQELEQREQIVTDFSNGEIRILSSKPELLGSGCNFQRHCHKAIFIGPTDKFNDFIQAVHRIYRFLQSYPVEIHIVFADSQYDTVMIMRNKWERHEILQANMQAIIRKHGLSGDALKMKLTRDMHIDRDEVTGKNYRAIRNDCVKELATWEDNSVDEIVTSIPFSDHYEYSPHFADFGHNQGDDGFFEQFDYLVPELYRVLKPGRIACIHTKDRIQYGTMTGNAMYSVNPFSDKTVLSFQKHGWIYMGRIVIDTDVVRENAQTYRLGHTENSKDSTKMGCGSTEFVLIFRKWEPSMSPNQTANGPDPVTKDKTEYTRAKWQIHASGIWRSSGNELVSPQMLKGMETSEIYHWWRNYCEENRYDYMDHVKFTEAVESVGKLPASMMLLAPCSNNPDIWTDIVRIATLNTELSRKTTESHVCPLQTDVCERLIERYSNPGDTILDPFGGIHTVPYVAIGMGRKGIGIELNPNYWRFGVTFCERADREIAAPTLFDMLEDDEVTV
jgi:DNA modification methylase